jgi:hypothetical protein
MDDPICVDGTWTTNDSCLGACDEPAVACSGTVVAFADAPGADTDADLAALLDALEPSLAARAFARALFDAWMAVIERESAALSAAMEGLAETDVVVTADLLSCLLERLPPSIDALQASVDALAARYATAASTYADACE